MGLLLIQDTSSGYAGRTEPGYTIVPQQTGLGPGRGIAGFIRLFLSIHLLSWVRYKLHDFQAKEIRSIPVEDIVYDLVGVLSC